MFHFRQDHRGIITVFVTLILVPSVAFTGLMVDVARLKASFQMRENANQMYAASVLAQYDGLLQDMYGLYALTQDQGKLDSAREYAMKTAMPGNYDSTGTGGKELFNPLGGYEIEPSLSFLENANLRNTVVLQNQISDYMKYRAAVTLLDNDLLNSLDAVAKIGEDSKVINKKAKLDQAVEKLNSLYQDYYKLAENNDSLSLGELYSAWRADTMEDCKEISQLFDELKELSPADEESGDEEPEQAPSEEDKQAIKELQDKIKKKAKEIQDRNKAALLALNLAERNVNDLYDKAGQIDQKAADVKKKLDEVKTASQNASEDLKKGLEDELESYEALLLHDFVGFTGPLKDENLDQLEHARLTINNAKYGKYSFAAVANHPQDCEKQEYSIPKVTLSWATVDAANHDVMKKLKEWYGSGGSEPNQDSKNEQKSGQDKLEQEKEVMEEEEPQGAKKIPDGVYHETPDGSTDAPPNSTDGSKLTENISDQMGKSSADGSDISGLLTKAAGVLNTAVNKVLLVEYGMSMFTCATTGKEMQDDGTVKQVDSVSMAGIPQSPEVNFLYSSELEYLYGGNQIAKENRQDVKNVIFGTRFILNFIYTYKNSEVKKEIELLAKAVSGGNALVEIIARLAIRGVVVALESYHDVSVLLKGGKIPLMKNESSWVFSVSGAVRQVADSGDSGKKKGLELGYQDYLRLMLLLFRDSAKVTQRTADLVELNLTNYQEGINGDDTKMTALTFQAADAHTAFTTKVRGKLPFLFSAEVFQVDNSSLSDRWFEASVTRGY